MGGAGSGGTRPPNPTTPSPHHHGRGGKGTGRPKVPGLFPALGHEAPNPLPHRPTGREKPYHILLRREWRQVSRHLLRRQRTRPAACLGESAAGSLQSTSMASLRECLDSVGKSIRQEEHPSERASIYLAVLHLSERASVRKSIRLKQHPSGRASIYLKGHPSIWRCCNPHRWPVLIAARTLVGTVMLASR